MASLRLGGGLRSLGRGGASLRAAASASSKASPVEFSPGSAQLNPWVGDATDKAPQKVRLEAGKSYAWCACGNSRRQPWCDGSHAKAGNPGLRPVHFTATRDADVFLCLCRQTKNKPFCDGSHKLLPPGPLNKNINDHHIYRTDSCDAKGSVAWRLGYHHKDGMVPHKHNRR